MPDNEIKTFEHEKFGKVRTIQIKGEPWVVAKDVAEILGYSDTQAMTRSLDEDEISKIAPDVLSGANSSMARELAIISEPGLYNAVIGSKKPEAREFRKWIRVKVFKKDAYGVKLYTWEDITPCDPEGLAFACTTDEGTVMYGEDFSGETGFPYSVSFSTAEYYLEEDCAIVHTCYTMAEAKEFAEKMVEEIRTRNCI